MIGLFKRKHCGLCCTSTHDVLVLDHKRNASTYYIDQRRQGHLPAFNGNTL